MAKEIIDIGLVSGDNTGDPIRVSFDKVNNNFDEVYTAGPVGTDIQIEGNNIHSQGNIVLNPANSGSGNGLGTVHLTGNLSIAGTLNVDTTIIDGGTY